MSKLRRIFRKLVRIIVIKLETTKMGAWGMTQERMDNRTETTILSSSPDEQFIVKKLTRIIPGVSTFLIP